MDVVTHALIGLNGAGTLLPGDRIVDQLCLAVGSFVPDLDVLVMTFGRRHYLRWHRTFSHSLFALPVGALAGWAFARLVGYAHPATAALAFAAGIAFHLALDALTSFPLRLFWPLSRRGIELGWLFLVDPVLVLGNLAVLGLMLAGCGELARGVFLGLWPVAAIWTALRARDLNSPG